METVNRRNTFLTLGLCAMVALAAAPAFAQQASPERGQDNARFTMLYPTGDAGTSVLKVEQETPRQVRKGEEYAYKLHVTNLTQEPLAGVVVIQNLDKGFEFSSANPQPAESTDQQRWVIGDLLGEETKTLEVNAIPQKEGALGACFAVVYEPTLCTVVEAVQANLNLTKQGPEQAYICEDIVYRYILENTGSAPAENVRIIEELPQGMKTAQGQAQISIDAGNIGAGESQEFEIALRPEQPGEFTSRAIAKSTTDEVNSSALTTRIVQPELAVDLEGPQWQYSHEPITYTAKVTNKGQTPARDTVLIFSGDVRAEDARQIGMLEPGQTETVTITMEGRREGNIQVEAEAEAWCAATALAKATTEIRTIPALLLETVDNMDPVRVGSSTTYSITVKNQGTADANNVKLTAELPKELEFVAASGASDVTSDGANLDFGALGNLPPGEIANWTVEARARSEGDVRLRVELDSDYLDSPVPDVEPTRLTPQAQ